MNAEIKTVDSVLGEASNALKAAGLEIPRREAEMLLGHVLGCPRTYLLAHPEALVNREQAEICNALLARRCRREPLPYILGKAPFLDFELRVGPGVLIPRPETELLVETTARLLPASSPGKPLRVVDVGTGSGAIALGIARLRSDVEVCATEISPAALAIARDNIQRLGLQDRVQVLEGDLFEPLSDIRKTARGEAVSLGERIPLLHTQNVTLLTDQERITIGNTITNDEPPNDRAAPHPEGTRHPAPGICPHTSTDGQARGPAPTGWTQGPPLHTHTTPYPDTSIARGTIAAVLSNPPYIPSAEIPGLQPEVSVYEPRGALDGGPDGLAVIRRLVQETLEWLAPGGFLAFEIGAGQGTATSELLRTAGYSDVRVFPDLAGIERVVVAWRC